MVASLSGSFLVNGSVGILKHGDGGAPISLKSASISTIGGTSVHDRTESTGIDGGYRRINKMDQPSWSTSAPYSLAQFDNYNHDLVDTGSNFDATAVASTYNVNVSWNNPGTITGAEGYQTVVYFWEGTGSAFPNIVSANANSMYYNENLLTGFTNTANAGTSTSTTITHNGSNPTNETYLYVIVACFGSWNDGGTVKAPFTYDSVTPHSTGSGVGVGCWAGGSCSSENLYHETAAGNDHKYIVVRLTTSTTTTTTACGQFVGDPCTGGPFAQGTCCTGLTCDGDPGVCFL